MEFIKHETDGMPKGVKNDDLIAYRTQSSNGDLHDYIPVKSKFLNWLKADPNRISKIRPSEFGEIVEYAVIKALA